MSLACLNVSAGKGGSMNPGRLELMKALNARVQGEFERLLKTSQPKPWKLFKIGKALQSEAPHLDVAASERAVEAVFGLSYDQRTAARVGRLIGVEPTPWLMQQFELSFTNGLVSEA